jgi:1,2-diacylglycerol 3-beta-glucosyltransferase
VTTPYDGLPVGWYVPLGIGLVVVLAMLAWTAVLFVRAQRWRRLSLDVAAEAEFTWVFLVPALNEEVTIRDSVSRLLDVDVARRLIMVIDDGSDDATPALLADIEHPDLVTLRRQPPRAREGKAAALNHAYRALEGLLVGVDRDKVIVVVVDADGRLDRAAPRYAAEHFVDPAVGGVQSLVRIYNRQRLLTWMQDVEFSVYGHLFQAGRNDWGTAGMGGNGQFNRLSALDRIADENGPWRDRLTEDQDLGLRLVADGWEGRHELRAVVEQQGLSSLRPLLRQRTRWSQGNLQAMGLTGDVWRAPFPRAARVELLLYLLMPLWQGLVGAVLVVAIGLAAFGVAPFWAGGPTWQLLLVWTLAFGGTILGCVASGADRGVRGWAVGILIGHAYALYTWMLWPVLVRSAVRQLTERRDWVKTEREPIAAREQVAAPPGSAERRAPAGVS